jgi:anti-sigma-K factor RskA
MNEQNEKWLDEQLKKTIDSGKVEFDSEQWKQKYSAEYQALVSRAENRPNVQRFLWVRPLVRVAAIVAIVAFVILLTHHQSDKRVEPTVATFVEDRSPAKVLSVLSLSLAYRQGGLDAVDEQYKKAFKMLGQKNTKVSIGELLNENNGQKPERNDL